MKVDLIVILIVLMYVFKFDVFRVVLFVLDNVFKFGDFFRIVLCFMSIDFVFLVVVFWLLSFFFVLLL